MAVVLVGANNQRMHDMGDTDGTTGIGSIQGAAPAAEPDFFLQGSNSISKKVGTTLNGIEIDTSAFGTPRVENLATHALWMAKLQSTNKNALLGIGAPAAIVRIGSGSGDYWEIDVHGNEDEFYPLKGGWVIEAINASLTALQGNVTGTPLTTAIDFYTYGSDFSATSRAENVMCDAIDMGTGLALTRGDSTDPDGIFADYIIVDQDTTGTGRFGFFTEIDGIITCLGGHFIGRNESGTAAITVFNDTGRTIVFPDSLHGNSDAGFGFDLTTSGTDIDWNNITIFGKGHRHRLEFDTETDMNATSDEIQSTGFETFRPGDYVVISDEDGTETPGPVDGTSYWIGKDLVATPTGITLHTTRVDALQHSSAGTGTPVALTLSSAGNGERWAVNKNTSVDTRPVMVAINNTGTLDFTGCIFEGINVFNLTSTCVLTDCTITKTEQLSGDGATYANCTFSDNTTTPLIGLVVTNTNTNLISDCSFDGSGVNDLGHAFSRSTTSAGVSFDGNTFTGYGGSTTTTDHEFDNTDDVDAGADTITMATGDVFATGEAIVYSKELTANTVVTGLTTETRYYVNRVSSGVYSLHLNKGDAINDNARIGLTVGTGNETHALYSGNAAFFNTSGGSVVLNISNGDTPSVRNNLDATTTINANVTLTFDELKDNTEVRIYAAGTSTELDGIENATAGGVDDRNFPASISAGTSVDYVLHNLLFETIRVEAFTWPSTAQTLIIQQRLDRNYDNPA